MLSMKYIFAICIVLVLASTIVNVIPRGAKFDIWTAVSIGIVASSTGSAAIIYLERKRVGYKWFVSDIPAERDIELLHLLRIDKITPKNDCIIVQGNGKLVGHAYARISDVPYLIDDLDRERKVWYVGNFARILSTLSFTFEIIPRIMPVSTEAYMKNVNKQIEDLRLTISSEGSTANPAREARLKNLEKLNARLLTGEGTRDVGFLAHIMVEGKDEAQIANQLNSNMKTMISALESGLGIKAERIIGFHMLETVQEFFRASPIVEPSKTCRMLSWDIAYLIPFTRPKVPPIEKLIGGVYLGRTSSGAMVCLDLKKYANPHLAILGKSGFGKSTTVKTFISRLFDLSATPTLIIDYAGEYLDWVMSRKGLIIDMRKDRINPFELGRTTLIDRVRQVIDSFEKTCDFQTINQRNAFAEYVSKVYMTKGYKLDDPETWKFEPPTLADIIDLMKKDMNKIPALKQLTVQSLIYRLEALASGPFGIFGQSTISIDQLTQGLTCIDLSKVSSNILKDLIAWTILQYLDTMMRIEGVTDEIRLVIVLDEAWKVCKNENSLPVAIIKEGRKYGYSLIVSTQDIIDIAEPILSNAGTTIIHRTEHPRYLDFFKRAYDLTETEISRIRNLPIGEAIVKLSIDPKPFFVKVEMEEVDSAHKSNETNISKDKRFSYSKTEKISPPLANQANLPTAFSSDLCALTEVEGRMLKIVAEEHVFSTSELYVRMSVNERQGNEAKNQLIKKDLVQTLKLPKVSGRGRKPEGIMLTDLGVAEAKKRGFKVEPEAGRRGGLLHRYLVELAADEFKKRGSSVEVERSIGNGQTIDLVIDDRIDVEIETGESDFLSNIEKLQRTKYEKVLIVCINQAVKRRVEEKAKSLAGMKISVVEVSELNKVLNVSGENK